MTEYIPPIELGVVVQGEMSPQEAPSVVFEDDRFSVFIEAFFARNGITDLSRESFLQLIKELTEHFPVNLNFLIHSGGGFEEVYQYFVRMINSVRFGAHGGVTRAFVPRYSGSYASTLMTACDERFVGQDAHIHFHAPARVVRIFYLAPDGTSRHSFHVTSIELERGWQTVWNFLVEDIPENQRASMMEVLRHVFSPDYLRQHPQADFSLSGGDLALTGKVVACRGALGVQNAFEERTGLKISVEEDLRLFFDQFQSRA